jgi:hypothetical protein
MLYTGTIVKMAAEPRGREYIVKLHDTHAGTVTLEGLLYPVHVGLLMPVRDPFAASGQR